MASKKDLIKDYICVNPWWGSHQCKVELGQTLHVRFDKRIFNEAEYGGVSVSVKSDYMELKTIDIEDSNDIIIILEQPIDEKIADLIHRYETGINLGSVIVTFSKNPCPIYICVYIKGSVSIANNLKSGRENFRCGGYGDDNAEDGFLFNRANKRRFYQSNVGSRSSTTYYNNYNRSESSYNYQRNNELDIYKMSFSLANEDNKEGNIFDIESLVEESKSVNTTTNFSAKTIPTNCLNRAKCEYQSQLHCGGDFCMFCGAITGYEMDCM